jgi:hypothetical protein
MLYVLLGEHSPETCPMSNATNRDLMVKGAPEFPHLAKRLNVKVVAGPFANREHVLVVVLESEKSEAVDEFIRESGLAQWNKVRILPSVPLEEGMKEIANSKSIF